MTSLRDLPITALQFYLTASYPCSYLENHEARSQVATPSFLISTDVYSELVRHGFRRSGTFTYRPRCDNCMECIPVRIEVDAFQPSRSQRRTWNKLQHIDASLQPLNDKPEYFDLYKRYQQARHRDGGMSNDNHDQYQKFLLQSHVESALVEFRENSELRMVSIIDALNDGLSSVYTFFEPDMPQAGFGTYNILWQIELCRQLKLPYLYLGFWIKDSQKMVYKSNFKPLQGLVNGQWQVLFS